MRLIKTADLLIAYIQQQSSSDSKDYETAIFSDFLSQHGSSFRQACERKQLETVISPLYDEKVTNGRSRAGIHNIADNTNSLCLVERERHTQMRTRCFPQEEIGPILVLTSLDQTFETDPLERMCNSSPDEMALTRIPESDYTLGADLMRPPFFQIGLP